MEISPSEPLWNWLAYLVERAVADAQYELERTGNVANYMADRDAAYANWLTEAGGVARWPR